MEEIKPKTRIEYFLNKIAEAKGGGGSGSGGIFVVHAKNVGATGANVKFTLDQTADDLVSIFQEMPIAIFWDGLYNPLSGRFYSYVSELSKWDDGFGEKLFVSLEKNINGSTSLSFSLDEDYPYILRNDK